MPIAASTEGGAGAGPVIPTYSPSTSPASGKSSGSGTGPNSSAMGDLLSGTVASSDALADEAYQNALANVSTSRNQLLQQYGYNADGTLNSNDPYGLYQQGERSFTRAEQDIADPINRESRDYGTALSNERLSEAGAMTSAHEAALARGLHGGGVAGKGEAAAMQAAAIQRANLDTQHGDALSQLGKQQSDLEYQHGLGQYQTGMNLTNALSGLDQQNQSATFDRNSAYHDALMNEVMTRLQNPNQYAGG